MYHYHDNLKSTKKYDWLKQRIVSMSSNDFKYAMAFLYQKL